MNKKKIIEYLCHNLNENILAHAFLIETNNNELCKEDIIGFIKNNSNEPVYEINPDGKNIKKKQIHLLIKKFSKTSVDNIRSFYIINKVENFNDSSCNSILKFLEEPPIDITGFLICNNKDAVIDTIKSRCQLLKINYKENDIELNSLSHDIVSIIEEKQNKLITLDNYKNDELEINSDYVRNSLIEIKNYYAMKLNDSNLNHTHLKKIKLIDDYLLKLMYNVNIELILDNFIIEMRKI